MEGPPGEPGVGGRPARMGSGARAVTALWLSACTAAFASAIHYTNTEGARGAAPTHLPAQERKSASDQRYTLVVAAHPRCPCTRATMAELARAMPYLGDRVSVRVLVYLPESEAESWATGAVLRGVKALPGATVVFDRGGAAAARLGALTSGHVLLFGPSDELLFAGGVTGARGHEGANAGRDALVSWVRRHEGPAATPVFGCALTALAAAPDGVDRSAAHVD